MTALSPAFRRLLALGLLVVPLALLGPAAAVPVLDAFAAYGQSITQSRALLARHHRVLDSKAGLEKRLEQVRGERIVTDGFFSDRTAELAAASIQQVVQKSVPASGAQLASVQVLPVQADNGFTKVGVRVAMAGTIDGLRSMLCALESAWPLLFTDNVNIEVQSMRAVRGQQAMPEAGDLQISFDVSGYLAKGIGQAAKGMRK